MFIDDFTAAHLEYRNIFDGNNEFIAEKLEEDALYFDKLSKGQKPKYLIVGCSDSRVPPNDLTKTQPGDIFNHRNIGNQVRDHLKSILPRCSLLTWMSIQWSSMPLMPSKWNTWL